MMKACNRRTGGHTSVQPHYAMWKHALHLLKLSEGWHREKPPAVEFLPANFFLNIFIRHLQKMSNVKQQTLLWKLCDGSYLSPYCTHFPHLKNTKKSISLHYRSPASRGQEQANTT